MKNITVTIRTSACMSASFSLNDDQYHVWFDPATMQLIAPILYKNPPKGTKYRGPGYFDVRKLNAETPKNAALIAKLLQIVVDRKLVDDANAKIRAEADAQAYESYVIGVVRDYWISIMSGATAARPHAITDEQFQAVSTRLAEKL